MKKIEIKSILHSDIIKTISREMGVAHVEEEKEYRVEIPPEWGTGFISGVQFGDGFGLLQYDCVFHDNVEIHFAAKIVQPIMFIYCLDGHIQVRIDGENEFFVMKKYYSAILASRGENGHIFTFPGNQSVKVRNLEISRGFFHDRFISGNSEEETQLRNLFDDSNANDAFYFKGMYSVTLSDLFKKIDDYPHDGITRTVFMEAVALEVLSEQLCLYEEEQKNKELPWRLREYELSCIGVATEIIKEELEDLCTIPELAHRTGLNVNKLQEGFKMSYNMTVNQYIHEIRLKRSIQLLRESEYNISEIVAKVGLNSKSYFSKIFKDAYGITPTGYRKEKYKKAKDRA